MKSNMTFTGEKASTTFIRRLCFRETTINDSFNPGASEESQFISSAGNFSKFNSHFLWRVPINYYMVVNK